MAIAVVQTAVAGSTGGTTVTTGAVDTTGANLIVISVSSYNSAVAPTDSKGNTWTPLTDRLNGAYHERLYYCASPTVGSGHTFTAAGAASYPTICVLAFSGAHATPFDQESGGGAASGTSSQPGSITPSEDNCVLVTGVDFGAGVAASINGSFTASSVDYDTSDHMGGGIAYKIQTTAGAENPTWSWTISGVNATAMASFKAAASSYIDNTSPIMRCILWAAD